MACSPGTIISVGFAHQHFESFTHHHFDTCGANRLGYLPWMLKQGVPAGTPTFMGIGRSAIGHDVLPG
jgi:hypothetical protein